MKHSKTLEQKRLNIAADEINKGSIKEYMIDQHIQTIHYRNVSQEVYDCRTDYI